MAASTPATDGACGPEGDGRLQAPFSGARPPEARPSEARPSEARSAVAPAPGTRPQREVARARPVGEAIGLRRSAGRWPERGAPRMCCPPPLSAGACAGECVHPARADRPERRDVRVRAGHRSIDETPSPPRPGWYVVRLVGPPPGPHTSGSELPPHPSTWSTRRIRRQRRSAHQRHPCPLTPSRCNAHRRLRSARQARSRFPRCRN